MNNLNKMSVLTIIAAIFNIGLIIYLENANASYFSAVFAWIVVITTQLSLIAVRMKNE